MFQPGEEVNEFMILVTGAIQLTCSKQVPFRKRTFLEHQHFQTIVTPGSFLNESSIRLNENKMTAITQAECIVIRLPKGNYALISNIRSIVLRERTRLIQRVFPGLSTETGLLIACHLNNSNWSSFCAGAILLSSSKTTSNAQFCLIFHFLTFLWHFSTLAALGGIFWDIPNYYWILLDIPWFYLKSLWKVPKMGQKNAKPA